MSKLLTLNLIQIALQNNKWDFLYIGHNIVADPFFEKIEIKEYFGPILLAHCLDGETAFDTSKPDGMPQKLLDVTRITDLGWRAKISLTDGVKQTYHWYLENSQLE